MLAVVLALVMAAAIPAVAQVDLGAENESESEGLETSFEVSNEGDYANQCVPSIQFGNTGNFNNAPTFLQYSSESGDFEPEMEVGCDSTVQQSSAASSTPTYTTPPPPTPPKKY